MCALFGIVFLGAIVALAVWALFRVFPDLRRQASGIFPEARQEDPAEEILRGRLARGEINAEEYAKALRVLKR